MPTAEEIRKGERETALWISMLGGPSVWLIQFMINYVLVPWTCLHGHHYLLHLTSAVFLAAALLIGFLGYREWCSCKDPSPASRSSGLVEPARLMAGVGIMNSALFSLAIIAQSVPAFFLSPCSQ